MGDLRLTSLNVRGLRTPERRKMILTHLRKFKTSVAFLQETHFKTNTVPVMTDRYFSHSYHAVSSDSRSKGVSILIAKNVPWNFQDVYADSEGRFLFLKGNIADHLVTFATVYLPNSGQVSFLEHLLMRFSQFAEGSIILGGDFNFTLDPVLDSSKATSHLSFAARRRIRRCLHLHQMSDVWRIHHPSVKDYTFFSPVHDTYSRIDFFLVKHCQLTRFSGSSIGNITMSDHAPIFLSIRLGDPRPPAWNWRLNDSLMENPSVLADLRGDLETFFQTNATSDSSPHLVWETHKAFARGILIKHGSRLKRERTRQISETLAAIHVLESSHKRLQTKDTLVELTHLRDTLRTLCMVEVKAVMARSRRSFYEYGNKCSRSMANALRARRARNFVSSIHTSQGEKTCLPDAIAASFRSYYTNLYNLNPGQSVDQISKREAAIRAYLERANMPGLPAQVIEHLESPIAPGEFDLALKSSRTGRAPGPDGYSLIYYKTLGDLLRPHFLSAFNSLSTPEALHQSALMAHITVIPKEGKDPLHCSNYRPISLLNVDLKLFSKILARRLSPYLPDLIHFDQVGFVPHREARDGTNRAINLIYAAKTQAIPCFLLSTDAEKAFDRVDWSFLRITLEALGLGPQMRSWIGSLYSSPRARIRVNGLLSEPFNIRNGTRQGCPLSPFIFLLILEPFLRIIRAHPDISGIHIGNQHHKVSAYADDLLFFITNPHISTPNLLQELSHYGVLSNFCINFQKSEALNLSLSPAALTSLQQNFPFRWAASHLTYLGISLPADLQCLFRLNFPPLQATFRQDLSRWQHLSFTWMGRCNIIKQNILPRLLYRLQAVPIFIPRSFLKALQSLINRFVWANKPSRLKHSILRRPKTLGGMALPDVHLYQLSVHLTRALDWSRHSLYKQWVSLEQSFSKALLADLFWCPLPRGLEIMKHPTIFPTWKACSYALTVLKLAPYPSPLLPIIGNPSFLPGLADRSFLALKDIPLTKAIHFLDGTSWISCAQMLAHPHLTHLGVLGSLQLSHFLKALPPAFMCDRPLTVFETECMKDGPIQHTLSLAYKLLLSTTSESDLSFFAKWELDLALCFSQEERRRILYFSFKSSISNQYQEAGYKLLTRWYRTPEILQKIYPSLDASCWRCGAAEGGLLHIFWDCPLLRSFWNTVHCVTQKFSDEEIPNLPAFFLLHHNTFSERSYKKSVVRHLVNAARACVPILWKSSAPPSIKQWLMRVSDIQRMEDLTSSLRNTRDKFLRSWFYWFSFTETAEYKTLLGL